MQFTFHIYQYAIHLPYLPLARCSKSPLVFPWLSHIQYIYVRIRIMCSADTTGFTTVKKCHMVTIRPPVHWRFSACRMNEFHPCLSSTLYLSRTLAGECLVVGSKSAAFCATPYISFVDKIPFNKCLTCFCSECAFAA